MPELNAATFTIALKPAKTHGLAELGVPMDETTEVKKGKLVEAMQMLGGDKIGRRYQNLRATLIKTSEGGQPGAKLVLVFEVFGDDSVPVDLPCTMAARLLAGDQVLAELPLGAPFMPYASCWYANHFAANVVLDAYAAADQVQLLVAAESVRAI
jgi:hypothetical protein